MSSRITVSLIASEQWVKDATCTACRALLADRSEAPIVEACIDSDGVLQMTGRRWCGPECQQTTVRAEED